MVKIYGALPLLASETIMKKKIKFYHDFDVRVSTGSTIAEFAILENSLCPLAKKAAKVGFDVIELGESNIDLDIEDKEKIIDMIRSQNLDFQWKVGKKDPRHQLSIEETSTKIDQATALGSKKVVLEANEGTGVGIYDEKGIIKWNFVGALTAKYPPTTFVFEAPYEPQQSALIAEFGQRVNLAKVRSDAITLVESQRRGFLSKSVFWCIIFAKRSRRGSCCQIYVLYYQDKIPTRPK